MKLTGFLKGKAYNSNDIQSAIWAVADKKSASGIQNGSQAQRALRASVSSITGIKDPWYNKEVNYRLDEDRVPIASPTKISGRISYNVQRFGFISFVIYKASGEELTRMKMRNKVTGTGLTNFNFGLSVQGWSQGDYFVNVELGDEVIHEMEFTV